MSIGAEHDKPACDGAGATQGKPRRVMANRQAAQRSRMRKLQHISDLEGSLQKRIFVCTLWSRAAGSCGQSNSIEGGLQKQAEVGDVVSQKSHLEHVDVLDVESSLQGQELSD